jgi:microcystin-dependent protein
MYYLGEIVAFATPSTTVDGWHLCDGSILPIYDYQELYSLIGTTYGGDGIYNFAVPNLCSRIIVSCGDLIDGDKYNLGDHGGVSTVILKQNQMPSHNHMVYATKQSANSISPVDSFFATPTELNNNTRSYLSKAYAQANLVELSPIALEFAGSDKAHINIMPSLAVHYMICTNGFYPSSTDMEM